jgi:hypothetical protein
MSSTTAAHDVKIAGILDQIPRNAPRGIHTRLRKDAGSPTRWKPRNLHLVQRPVNPCSPDSISCA